MINMMFNNVCSKLYFQIRSQALSTSSSRDVPIYRLKSRGLVRVKGPDTIAFLQGMVTSDVESLGSVMGTQYAMLLNVQVRDYLIMQIKCCYM